MTILQVSACRGTAALMPTSSTKLSPLVCRPWPQCSKHSNQYNRSTTAALQCIQSLKTPTCSLAWVRPSEEARHQHQPPPLRWLSLHSPVPTATPLVLSRCLLHSGPAVVAVLHQKPCVIAAMHAKGQCEDAATFLLGTVTHIGSVGRSLLGEVRACTWLRLQHCADVHGTLPLVGLTTTYMLYGGSSPHKGDASLCSAWCQKIYGSDHTACTTPPDVTYTQVTNGWTTPVHCVSRCLPRT